MRRFVLHVNLEKERKALLCLNAHCFSIVFTDRKHMVLWNFYIRMWTGVMSLIPDERHMSISDPDTDTGSGQSHL